jgi:RNA polymerase sigma-70 factor, ECF subfamily
VWSDMRDPAGSETLETVAGPGRHATLSPMRGDEALAQAARNDHAAFLALYDRYAVRVGRYVTAHIANPSDAEDVVSLVFMRVLERIHQYRPERGSFAAWLFGIARNTVREHYRKGWRFVPLLASHRADIGPSAEDTVLHRDALDAVGLAVQHLTSTQRDALALRFVAGLTYAEAGRLMGKNEDACRKLVGRTIESLRLVMDEEDER